jgi:Tol biopolymer transport system component
MNAPLSVGALTRRLLPLAVVCITALAAGAPAAFGSFPGANGRIAFVSVRGGNPDDPDIWTMRPNGSDQVNLTAEPAWDIAPNWRADGRKIAFQSNRVTANNPTGDFEVFVMNADGSNPRQITFNLNDDGQPAWSPDGRKLVFVHQMFSREQEAMGLSNHDLWTMGADGTNQRDVTPDPYDDHEPNWSPDGTRIAFTTNPAGNSDVYTIKPDGSALRRLTDKPGIDSGANWSPDGRMLAFDSERDGPPDVYVMRGDGRDQTRLTSNRASDLLSVWSPDARSLAFTTDRDVSDANPDNVEIYTMRADGSRQVNRTNNPAFDIDADWQPLPDDDR